MANKPLTAIASGVKNTLPLQKLREMEKKMKVLSSLKSAKTRDKDNRVVRRKGRLYVINKKNPRMKARQG